VTAAASYYAAPSRQKAASGPGRFSKTLADAQGVVYYSCMATKTITLELDAYEKLRRAKRSPRESFSSVVRRAVIPDESFTAAELLEWMRRRMKAGNMPLDETTLARLEDAQGQPRVSETDW